MIRRLLIVAVLLAPAALGDYVKVKQHAKVKAQPTSNGAMLQYGEIGDLFDLLAATAGAEQQNGYLHVQSPAGPGWIWGRFVDRIVGPLPGGVSVPVADGSTEVFPRKLEVHVIDVGQGDALLIRCPHGTHELLIDAGDTRYPQSAANFRAYMGEAQATDNPIEVVVATHPHADHIGSLEWVLTTYRVEEYVDSGKEASTKLFNNLATAITKSGVRHLAANDPVPPNIDFCPSSGVSARIIRPANMEDPEDANNASVVLRVDYGQSSFLFVGDAEIEEEDLLLEDPATRALLDCDFLKAGHHGSDTSSTKPFLDAVSPAIVAVSCGRRDVGTNARYKHPRLSTVENFLSVVDAAPGPARSLEAFSRSDMKWHVVQIMKALHVTAVEGDLVFTSDGTNIALMAGDDGIP